MTIKELDELALKTKEDGDASLSYVLSLLATTRIQGERAETLLLDTLAVTANVLQDMAEQELKKLNEED